MKHDPYLSAVVVLPNHWHDGTLALVAAAVPAGLGPVQQWRRADLHAYVAVLLYPEDLLALHIGDGGRLGVTIADIEYQGSQITKP